MLTDISFLYCWLITKKIKFTRNVHVQRRLANRFGKCNTFSLAMSALLISVVQQVYDNEWSELVVVQQSYDIVVPV